MLYDGNETKSIHMAVYLIRMWIPSNPDLTQSITMIHKGQAGLGGLESCQGLNAVTGMRYYPSLVIMYVSQFS